MLADGLAGLAVYLQRSQDSLFIPQVEPRRRFGVDRRQLCQQRRRTLLRQPLLQLLPHRAALLSGGNVDVTMLERIIKHGLTAEGRIASFSTVLPDQPNALATYLAALSQEGVNVLEVYHERSSMKVGVGSCRVRMVVETRNHEHIHQLYSYLAERGYTIKE